VIIEIFQLHDSRAKQISPAGCKGGAVMEKAPTAMTKALMINQRTMTPVINLEDGIPNASINQIIERQVPTTC
jgi:hypothetical protein